MISLSEYSHIWVLIQQIYAFLLINLNFNVHIRREHDENIET